MSYRSEHKLTHASFKAMRDRCNNPGATSFHLYGGRGISVCPQWSHFPQFLADMGERPSADHSLDRIDPNKNYEPSNCRWATKLEQSINRRPYIETPIYSNNTSGYKGVSKVGGRWCARTKVLGKTVFIGSFLDAREAAEAYIFATASCFK